MEENYNNLKKAVIACFSFPFVGKASAQSVQAAQMQMVQLLNQNVT